MSELRRKPGASQFMCDWFALATFFSLAITACASDPGPSRAVADRLPPQPVMAATERPKGPEVSLAETQCMALNLYWEARGEGRRGMQAVGWTVLNRVEDRQFPSSVCGVVRQGGETPPCQFSWWCDGRSDRPGEPKAWAAALAVSEEMLSDPPPDPTGGALFYHNLSVSSPWKKTRQRTAQIGAHVFYR